MPAVLARYHTPRLGLAPRDAVAAELVERAVLRFGEGGSRVAQRLEVEADALLKLRVRLAAELPRPIGLGARREALAVGRDLAEPRDDAFERERRRVRALVVRVDGELGVDAAGRDAQTLALVLDEVVTVEDPAVLRVDAPAHDGEARVVVDFAELPRVRLNRHRSGRDLELDSEREIGLVVEETAAVGEDGIVHRLDLFVGGVKRRRKRALALGIVAPPRQVLGALLRLRPRGQLPLVLGLLRCSAAYAALAFSSVLK